MTSTFFGCRRWLHLLLNMMPCSLFQSMSPTPPAHACLLFLMIYLSKSHMLILTYLDSIPTTLLSYLDWGWKSGPLCTCIEWMSTVKLETSGSSEMLVLGILSPSFLTHKFCTYFLPSFMIKLAKQFPASLLIRHPNIFPLPKSGSGSLP